MTLRGCNVILMLYFQLVTEFGPRELFFASIYALSCDLFLLL